MKKIVLSLAIASSFLVLGSLSATAAYAHAALADGQQFSSDVLATFVDYNGEELYETRVTFGGAAVYNGKETVRLGDAATTYRFVGWDKPLDNLRKDTLFTAQYEEDHDTLVATFVNINGAYLYSANVDYGKTPVYAGPTPTYSSVEGVTYAWTGGWDKALGPIYENTTYVATYDRTDSRHQVAFYDQNDNLLKVVSVVDGGDATLLAPSLPYVQPEGVSDFTRISPNWDTDIREVRADLVVHPVVMTLEESYYNVSFDAESDAYRLNAIDGASKLQAAGVLTMLDTYQNKPILSFNGAIYDADEVTELRLGSHLKSIRLSGTESLPNLEAIHLNDALETIESYGFFGLAKLRSVTYDESSLKDVGGYAFANTNLSVFEVPSSLDAIGVGAFVGTPIEAAAFTENETTYLPLDPAHTMATSLTDIDVALSHLRADCIGLHFTQPYGHRRLVGSLTELTFPSGFRFLDGGDSIFHAFPNGFQTLTFPASMRKVTAIDSYITSLRFLGSLRQFFDLRFSNIDWTVERLYIEGFLLTSLTVPSTVTEIPASLFRGVSSLSSVTFHDRLVAIGSSAFGRTALTSVTLPASLQQLGGYAFYGCDHLQTVSRYSNTGEEAVPLTLNGAAAFSGCGALTSVDFGGPVAAIPDFTFENCALLKNFAWPSGIASIGLSAFFGCQSITSLTIPSTVKTIGRNAFSYAGFSYVSIPNNVQTIEYYAFPQGCTIDFPGGLDQYFRMNVHVGYDVDSYENLRYRLSTYGYENSYVSIPSRVTALRDGALANFCNIYNVSMPVKLTSIGKRAFYNCTSLGSINLPTSLVNFSGDSFQGCTNIYSLSFEGNENFRMIDGDIYDSTGNSLLFVQPNRYGTYTVREGTITIGDGAFSLCRNLSGIVMASTVRIVGQEAISNCNLSEVVLNDGIEYLASRAFSGEAYYSHIGTLNLPASLRYCSDAFDNVEIDVLNLAQGFGEITGAMGTLTSRGINEVHYPGTIAHLMSLDFFRNEGWAFDGGCSFLNRAQRVYCLSKDPATLPTGEENPEVQVTRGDIERLSAIAGHSFYGATWLSNETAFSSSTIEYVGSHGFEQLNFETIAFSALKSLAPFGFARLYALQKADLRGSALEEIPDNAFYDDTELRTLLLPDSVRRIGEMLTFQEWMENQPAVNVLFPSSLEYLSPIAFGSSGIVEVKPKVNVLLPEGGLNLALFEEAGKNATLTFYGYGPGSGQDHYYELSATGEVTLH